MKLKYIVSVLVCAAVLFSFSACSSPQQDMNKISNRHLGAEAELTEVSTENGKLSFVVKITFAKKFKVESADEVELLQELSNRFEPNVIIGDGDFKGSYVNPLELTSYFSPDSKNIRELVWEFKEGEYPEEQANGKPIRIIIPEFNDELIIYLDSEKNDDTESTGRIKDLQELMSALGVNEPVVPLWLPEGFVLSKLDVNSSLDNLFITAVYTNGDKSIIFGIESMLRGTSPDIQMDEGNITPYESGGITHYLTSNMGVIKAIWANEFYCMELFGDLTKEELCKMIDSVYEV